MRLAITITLVTLAVASAGTQADAALTSPLPPAVLLRHIDTNHDGRITAGELTAAHARLSGKLPADLTAWLRARYDKNKDGVLDSSEFTAAWTGITVYVPASPGVIVTSRKVLPKKAIVVPPNRKRALDRNRDGRVDRAERHHLRRVVIRHR